MTKKGTAIKKLKDLDSFAKISFCFFTEYSIRTLVNNRCPREVNVPFFPLGQT